jgi:hypothetical protein
MGIVVVLVASLYVQSMGIGLTLKKYGAVAKRLKTLEDLKECLIVPLTDKNRGIGLQLSWEPAPTKPADKENDADEIRYQERMRNARLGLGVFLLVDPQPKFVLIRGPNDKIIIKPPADGAEPLNWDEYFD